MRTLKVMLSDPDRRVFEMFQNHPKFQVVAQAYDRPDLICFTGGEDVHPNLYAEPKLEHTYPNTKRDNREIELFKRFPGVPKVGICRGGQLLNVLSGGALWQDVDGHMGGHDVVNLLKVGPMKYTLEFVVSSDHHQMMIPGELGHVLAIAHKYDRARDRYVPLATTFKSAKGRIKPTYDTEVVIYPKTKCLCFQPHPEYSGYDKTKEYFFNLLEHFFFPVVDGTPVVEEQTQAA